jgi:regulatory protein
MSSSAATTPYDQGLAHAGRLLAARARTEKEIVERLSVAAFEPGVVQRVLGRLRELDLVDDAAFARQWIEERGSRGRGARLLTHELRVRGIDSDTIRCALEDAGGDETGAATELAARHLRRVADLPVAKQMARLAGLLARRGYPEEVVEEVVRSVLPPEGWD